MPFKNAGQPKQANPLSASSNSITAPFKPPRTYTSTQTKWLSSAATARLLGRGKIIFYYLILEIFSPSLLVEELLSAVESLADDIAAVLPEPSDVDTDDGDTEEYSGEEDAEEEDLSDE